MHNNTLENFRTFLKMLMKSLSIEKLEFWLLFQFFRILFPSQLSSCFFEEIGVWGDAVFGGGAGFARIRVGGKRSIDERYACDRRVLVWSSQFLFGKENIENKSIYVRHRG